MTTVIPWAFLTVSSVALVAQTIAFSRFVRRGRPFTANTHHLVRTVACRVFAAALYVGLGVTALVVSPATAGALALACFGLTQCLWLVNSALDVRQGAAPPGRSGDTVARYDTRWHQ